MQQIYIDHVKIDFQMFRKKFKFQFPEKINPFHKHN